MSVILNHEHELYKKRRKELLHQNKYNGAYYYSQEICNYIIPNVNTDRNWLTIRVGDECMDHSIVFIHNNLKPERYEYLKKYDDLILVCGVPDTCKKVKHLGTPIYLPLSVNVKEVAKYRQDIKIKGTAFAGRRTKANSLHSDLDDGIPKLYGMARDEFLYELAKYRNVYAVGRTAIEAKILGCKILPYDRRFPDPSIWKIFDSLDAARELQIKLDVIDHKHKKEKTHGYESGANDDIVISGSNNDKPK